MAALRASLAALRWLCALLPALALPASAAEGASRVEARIVEARPVPLDPPADSAATHELRLVLFMFRGTRWSAAEIEPAVRGAAALLEQCGVAFAYAELNVVEATRRFHFYHTPVSREFMRRVRTTRPAVFFVEDTHNKPAFDAEAIGRSNAAARPELADTVWIAHGARDLPQVLAHELVHVLADSGAHSREPGNLMHVETSPQNVRLSDAQCARLLARGEANGLLSRR